MKHLLQTLTAGLLCLSGATAGGAGDEDESAAQTRLAQQAQPLVVQLGPRPYYLLDQMADGPLRRSLARCAENRRYFNPAQFSIGHRGAPLQFPEHTRESYLAAARMGAGIIECDVTFTADRQLVCRHAQCDLHTTTDIVATPLAKKCSVPPELRRARAACSTRRRSAAAPAISPSPSSGLCAARWMGPTPMPRPSKATSRARRTFAPNSTPATDAVH
ncbi:MAG: glycerophosphodiester phosphodiesterase family protein [Halioglobus sp.]|nr:glycerophosphodiester phosphodiesterase family protein [Halioglobus sp.]